MDSDEDSCRPLVWQLSARESSHQKPASSTFCPWEGTPRLPLPKSVLGHSHLLTQHCPWDSTFLGFHGSPNPSCLLTHPCSWRGFPGDTSGKEPACWRRNIRNAGWIPGLGKSPGGEHGNPLQYSCLENPMDRGAWWATALRVAKSRTC